jgi:hypothetical protein
VELQGTSEHPAAELLRQWGNTLAAIADYISTDTASPLQLAKSGARTSLKFKMLFYHF